MKLKRLGRSAAVAVAALAYAVSPATAAETKGPVTDDIGVVKLAKGEPIQIGQWAVLSGPDAPLGIDQVRGVEVFFDQIGNEVIGHTIKHVIEDSQCTPEGGQTAATKFAANQKIVYVVGPTCSGPAMAGAPVLWKAGLGSVGVSTSAPPLTAPDRNPDMHGYARVYPNDDWFGVVTAEWMYNTAGARTMAGIHDGSTYAESLVKVAARSFEELGGKVTSIEAILPSDTDMRAMLTRIATNPPDAIFFPIYAQTIAFVARQAGDVNGLEKSLMVTSEGALSGQFLELVGGDYKGLQVAANEILEGPGYPAFVELYIAKFGEKPIGPYHARARDAAALILEAIKKVAVTDDAGNTYIGRKAVRDAVFATKGLVGLSGPKTCDENGDCGEFNYVVYEFTSATDPFVLGKNPIKTYP